MNQFIIAAEFRAPRNFAAGASIRPVRLYNADMNLGRLIERKLQEAREAGAFDHLPRKGRLDLGDDTGVPEDERLAMHMLKSNDLLPAWIEEDKALRAKLVEARGALYRAYVWRRRRLAQTSHPEDRKRIEQEWGQARRLFEQNIAEINRDIFHFNLRAPSTAVHRLPLRLQEEYERLERMAAEDDRSPVTVEPSDRRSVDRR